jgi:hypothetical protein
MDTFQLKWTISAFSGEISPLDAFSGHPSA